MSLFASCSFGFIVIKWMFRLLSRLKLSQKEPRDLIDNMSEGCLLYSFQKKKVTYCNSVAK